MNRLVRYETEGSVEDNLIVFSTPKLHRRRFFGLQKSGVVIFSLDNVT